MSLMTDDYLKKGRSRLLEAELRKRCVWFAQLKPFADSHQLLEHDACLFLVFRKRSMHDLACFNTHPNQEIAFFLRVRNHRNEDFQMVRLAQIYGLDHLAYLDGLASVSWSNSTGLLGSISNAGEKLNRRRRQKSMVFCAIQTTLGDPFTELFWQGDRQLTTGIFQLKVQLPLQTFLEMLQLGVIQLSLSPTEVLHPLLHFIHPVLELMIDDFVLLCFCRRVFHFLVLLVEKQGEVGVVVCRAIAGAMNTVSTTAEGSCKK